MLAFVYNNEYTFRNTIQQLLLFAYFFIQLIAYKLLLNIQKLLELSV